MPQLPRCPVTGKPSFASMEVASQWLASHAAEFTERPVGQPYPQYAAECQHCPYIHVSAKPPRRATLNRRVSKSRKNRRRFGGRNG